MFEADTHVLIVDDMLTMRKLVKLACTEIGFKNFTEAADGAEAWELLEKAEPKVGLVVSDWNMPHVTGLDLLKKVRADKRFTNIPFVLVTAESEHSQVRKAVEAGVSNYIVKPFTTEVFREKLDAVYQKLHG